MKQNYLKIFFTVLVLSLPLGFISAQISPSVSIQYLSPGSTVTPGNEVSFTAVTSGFSSGVSYSIGDSLAGSTVPGSASINSNGVFIWIPGASDGGTHYITITATDQSGNTASATQIITLNIPTVLIQSLSPTTGSVSVGSGVYFSAVASGFANSPIFTLGDAFSGTSLSGSNINFSGGFSWIPKIGDVGTHTVTVTATDSYGSSASVTQSITVNPVATSSIQSLSPGTTVTFNQPVTFDISTVGFTSPTFSLSDSFYGGSISNANIDSSGNFTWTPLTRDAGVHNLNIIVSDSMGNTISLSQTLTVNNASMTIVPATSSNIVNIGSTYSFSVTSSGLISPVYTASDSFIGGSVSPTNINSSGSFSWTPNSRDVGTHTVTVIGKDAYSHTASSVVTLVVPATATVQIGVTTPTVSPTASSHVFTASLSIGSTGSDVTALQNLLTAQGLYSGPVTGTYDSSTEASVKKFQTAHGVDSVGVVGPQTRAILNQSSTSNTSSTPSITSSTSDGYKFYSPLNIGSTGNDVTELQNRLVSAGVYSGPVTGYYGALTAAGVKKYQGLHNISQLGNVGPATRAALNSGL